MPDANFRIMISLSSPGSQPNSRKGILSKIRAIAGRLHGDGRHKTCFRIQGVERNTTGILAFSVVSTRAVPLHLEESQEDSIMQRLFQRVLCGALLGAAAMLAAAPVKAQVGDPYWRNHWNWYDSTYRPYYHRYYTPGYVYPSHPVPYYDWEPYYSPPPVRTYEDPVPGQRVLRYGWW
jgi:hypothetical protein